MKRRILEGCFLVFTIIIISLIIFPLFMTHHEPRKESCMSNLMQISLGIFMYVQDYDDKLPPAIFPKETVGWANGLQPYLKSTLIFQCPTEKTFPSATQKADQPGFTDYWINKNLTKADINDITFPNQIILLGDGDGTSPQSTASYAINKLPTSWLQSSDSPAKRHLGGANYAFLDGHVKWLKPEQATQVHPSKNNKSYTFRIK